MKKDVHHHKQQQHHHHHHHTNGGSGAKGKWKTLSNAFKKLRKGEPLVGEESDRPFRFPSFDVVEIRPDIAPTNAMDRLWLRVNAPNYSKNVDVKVSEQKI